MRLGVAGFSMMNVMLLSVAVWSGAEDATRDLFHWICADIALPTVVFCGQPFFQSALGRAQGAAAGHGRADLARASILASSISLYETDHSRGHTPISTRR